MGLFSKKEDAKYQMIIKSTNKSTNKILEFRKKVRILLIDDEEYEIFDLLKTRGYDVYYKSDIAYTVEVEPFDIVIIDIKGVAKKFGSPQGGFGFAAEVKRQYQHKVVICYSGTADNSINEQIDKIDGFIKKDTDIDQWSQKLDSYIKLVGNIEYHWKIIDKQLMDRGIDSQIRDKIKVVYNKSFDESSFDNLTKEFMVNVDDAKLLIEVISSIVALIKLFI